MDHYLDIHILPDPEFSPGLLMNALYAKLHKALSETARGDIGVSFPLAKKTPGTQLRLHASATALSSLMAGEWLKGMRDHIQLSDISPVPASHTHVLVSRYQPANAPHRLRSRSVRKGWLSEEEAEQRIPDKPLEESGLPYLQLKSNTNGNHFRLYIQQTASTAAAGKFNNYGLSNTCTVPFF